MSSPLKIALCSSSQGETNLLADMLRTSLTANEYDCFVSGVELLGVFRAGIYDLILLDDFMDGICGVETVRKIRELDHHVPLALLYSARPSHIYGPSRPEEFDALSYIEKPLSREDLDCLLRQASMSKEQEPCLHLMQQSGALDIPFSQILYIEQQKRQLFIHLDQGKIEVVFGKLSQLMYQFDPSTYLYCEPNYLVNLSFVSSFDYVLGRLFVANGKTIELSDTNTDKVRRALKNFLFNRTRSLLS